MSKANLSTDSYKGVRDFYPEDMAAQRYIFNTWSKTTESFGFERYDASILEPSELYKAKGAENEEIVNEQTYTFIDRGEREVTLRPEMTPTVARMVSGRRRELKFPLRWYSIPNLFRYERPQRGRLREHWQLNCDIFGVDDYTADVELILLAHQLLINFGAKSEMFEIRVNDRTEMSLLYKERGLTDQNLQDQVTRLNDRYHKISQEEYLMQLENIVGDKTITMAIFELVSGAVTTDSNKVVRALLELGLTNVKIDRSIARGFSYYTGTIFELFDVSGENNRAMLGGGRYDNLTSMFSDDVISGVGFGMGDVTMLDFLKTHQLLPKDLINTAPTLTIIPTDASLNLDSQKIAHLIRQRDLCVSVDIGSKKIGKKIADAAERGVAYTIVVGAEELSTGRFTLKNLNQGTEESGDLETIITELITRQ